jgi:UDP-2,4-diacetamido-2,4,6-trideoxy-beta-L-altropyranose hydrolase
MGTGHVMRCLALAQGWQEAGGSAVVAAVGMPRALEERIEAEGIAVSRLEVEPGSEADAEQTAALAGRLGARWVVVDGYQFGAEYQRALRDAGLRLLFADDWGHAGEYCADLVLNQNIYASEALYERREVGTRLLLGTRYALLRREFWPWRGRRREIAARGRRVLVTLGGADTENVTLKVLRACRRAGVEGLELVVVVGGGNPHYAELAVEVAGMGSVGGTGAVTAPLRPSARLERNATNMPELMAWADVAVSAGGSTCWELVFLGLPAVLLVLAENQRPIAAGLAAAGAAVDAGWHGDLSEEELARRIAELAGDGPARARMAQAGQALVDGRGAERVVRSILDFGPRVRGD